MTGMRHSVDASELVRDSRDRQVSFRFPLALDQRLDALMARAIAAGERTNRSELLLALILDCDYTGEDLGQLLRRLRTSTSGEAVLDKPVPADNLLQFAEHKPGPRTRPA